MINKIFYFIKSIYKFIYINFFSKFTNQYTNISGVFIGDFTYGNPTIAKFTNKYNLYIGKFCSISTNVKILVDGNHRIDWISTYPLSLMIKKIIPKNYGHPTGKGDINIGNDVWIGRDVLIMSGINIGDGAVIAAGSVVTKDVADYEIVGGNPAKHIKFRFTDDQIKSLKKISWWDWDIEKIKKNIEIIETEDINKFIDKYDK